MVPNMKDSKTTVMFAVLVATLVLALVSVSYIESVSAHHNTKGHVGKVNPCFTNDECVEDGPGDFDPDPDPPGEDDD